MKRARSGKLKRRSSSTNHKKKSKQLKTHPTDTERSSNSQQNQIEKEFLLNCTSKDGTKTSPDLGEIHKVTEKYRGKEIKLGNFKLMLGLLEDTMYKERPDLLGEWETFYLPDNMKMEVIGVLEGCTCSDEMVLMVCEDGKVFIFEDDNLHLTANSLKELFENNIQFPGSKFYYRGERFEDMTEADWEEVNKSEELIEKAKEHEKMQEQMLSSYLQRLELKQKQKRDEMRLNKLDRRAGSVVGVELDSVVTVA